MIYRRVHSSLVHQVGHTVGGAAKQLDRRFTGTDISEEYCDLARKRIAAIDGLE